MVQVVSVLMRGKINLFGLDALADRRAGAARLNSPGPEIDRRGRCAAGRAAASGNSGAGSGLDAELSGLQPADGQAQGEERRQCGRRILGVFRLSGVPGDSAD